MRDSRMLAVCAVAIAFTAGCTPDEVTSAPIRLSDPQVLAAVNSEDRPWKGTCDVDAIFTSEFTLLITGTCQLAHLGRTRVVEYQTITPGPNGVAYTNTATYTAANGDQLRTSGVGVATPTQAGLTLLGTETAIGGTGRFLNAGGTAVLSGSVRFTGPASTTGSYSLAGILNY